MVTTASRRGKSGIMISCFRLLSRLFFLLAFAFTSLAAQVRVRGYVRKDGTYVPPHVRSSPDRNPYNNWSYPGNINPYTGKVATGDPLAYLERYYSRSSSGSLPKSRVGVPAPIELPTELTGNLVPLPGAVPIEEIDRVRVYCRGLSSTVNDFDQCLTRQSYALAGLALPDYGSAPRSDLQRAAGYCEQLYGDNRAGFYNCLNRQVLGLTAPPADLSRASTSDRERATRYCALLYGDNRGGYADCLRRQAAGIPTQIVSDPAGIDATDWQRATSYCESLYDDNRAGYGSCVNQQRASLARMSLTQPYGLSPQEWDHAVRYCDSLYGDNRGGFASCVSNQRVSLETFVPISAGDLPVDEWNRALRYCENLYGQNRGGANNCRRFQRNGIANRRPAYSSDRANQCESLYSDNRAGYWMCAARPR